MAFLFIHGFPRSGAQNFGLKNKFCEHSRVSECLQNVLRPWMAVNKAFFAAIKRSGEKSLVCGRTFSNARSVGGSKNLSTEILRVA